MKKKRFKLAVVAGAGGSAAPTSSQSSPPICRCHTGCQLDTARRLFGKTRASLPGVSLVLPALEVLSTNCAKIAACVEVFDSRFCLCPDTNFSDNVSPPARNGMKEWRLLNPDWFPLFGGQSQMPW